MARASGTACSRRFGSSGGGGDLFGPEGLTLAAKTLERFVARAIRLYEQDPGETSRLRPVWIIPAAVDQVGGGGDGCCFGIREQSNPGPRPT